ncbi:glutaredoxin family protein [Rhodoferax sp.]|uniref:glutaredoxin family protein n=1 Tax=Rhodoferax sp. TaxID=50421 RepID=UPI0028492764|nr:glutaredoxin family protein [Rhodoferax sp.]MDR3371853.1 glutaredoxin family protein [Rhodoferax sp.]
MADIQHNADLYAQKPLKPLSRLGYALCFFALAALANTSLQAQTLYRIVGPDGRITFSDKPPTTPAKVTELSADGANVGAANATLPYELRQVASKYPVTLFTSKDCAPCDQGRTMLRSRGIPFAEKTINTNEDAESLKRLADTTSLPVLTIGGQQIKGYSAPEWTQYLNAAGYPASSGLPPSYRYAAPSPLVTVKVPAAPAAAAEPTPKTPATVAPRPRATPDNPAGIQF